MASEAASLDLLGGMDVERVAQNNRCGYRIAYLTAGNPRDPCVMVPPGAGSTKEENLFWAKELARLGPFFVVMYDLRGTGASEPMGKWGDVFFQAGTTPMAEMERVYGVQGSGKSSSDSGGAHAATRKAQPMPLDPAIANCLHDYDGYVEDAFFVLDELKIEKAHFMGLSQGGGLARFAAMRYPDRVLSCVSCCSTTSKVGLMMAAMSEGAEEYYNQIKDANLFTRDGKMPFDKASVTKHQYVEWRSTLLSIIAPGFDKDIYQDIAAKSFDAGYVDEHEAAICALAYEAFERQGKDKKHLEDLKQNKTVPIMFVHGRNDPVIHFGELQKLFAVTGNSVMEAHEYGHNLGPPSHQTRLLGRIATFMKRSAMGAPFSTPAGYPASADIGKDTSTSDVSPEFRSKLTQDASVPDLWEGFLTAQTAADTSFALDMLLGRLQLLDLRGQGLKLFLALKPALEGAGLQFRQKKLLIDLQASLLRAHKVVARVRRSPPEAVSDVIQETLSKAENQNLALNDVLVCGAGPVGLRTACELALLGFRVTVIEKRPNFSRANILTFWDETMNDMLALGAKSYFPSLQPTGTQKILGTRQIQVCLLKTLLLFGGTVKYGTEICGLRPPGSGASKWNATCRPYVKHRRAAEAEDDAKRCAAQERAGVELESSKDATDFQKAKDYDGKEIASVETWDVDPDFLDASNVVGQWQSVTGLDCDGTPIPFDAYVIAEGGWSDSTRKLGFSKAVEVFKPAFGLVANFAYDATDLKQRNMKSQIHFVLGKDWPLSNCPIQAEFVEYLKGETHFFALVVSKQNYFKDTTDKHLERMKQEDRDAIPDEVIEQMRQASKQKGLLEMGVFRKKFSSGKACLACDNVDMEKLHELVRDITQEMGLPATTEFYPTNPIQLFDFSRRARCVEPVRVLRRDSLNTSPTVLSPAQFLAAPSSASNDILDALVFPVGDALQEPIWTQGLGVNRGFHTGMNQAYACLLAREQGAVAAVNESCKIHEATCKIKWGMGHSGLAGSGSGNIGLKPFKQWDTDPRNRLPIK